MCFWFYKPTGLLIVLALLLDVNLACIRMEKKYKARIQVVALAVLLLCCCCILKAGAGGWQTDFFRNDREGFFYFLSEEIKFCVCWPNSFLLQINLA